MSMSSAQINPTEPPSEAAAFYAGWVMHQRMKPVGHRFQYDVFSLMVDLDRLDEADAQSKLFSVNRRNVVSFFERDHSGNDGSLREYADRLLQAAGLEQPAAKIILVCYPRILGLVFNPLAVYYAYDETTALVAVIYEVRNTFGERHTYVCPVRDGELSSDGLKQECDKIFHVSPFIPMNMRYHFHMALPSSSIQWRIVEKDPEGVLLVAVFSGQKQPLTTGNILRLAARIPHLTLKIVGAIHWEALKLWLKGVRYIPRPKAPPPVSNRGKVIIGDPAE